MYTPFDEVVLKSGEVVRAGVVLGPDAEWQERIEALLAHKGHPWRWQIHQLLTSEMGVGARFYVLHREGDLFSHIMTVEAGGIGLCGHVWTNPDERGQGAASHLMALLMRDVQSRGGRALYLGTAYDSPAYRIYRKHGFESVEPGSGVMTWFAEPQTEFESAYFAPGPTEIAPFGWMHWATSSALLAGSSPGLIRVAPFGIVTRYLSEGPLLPVLLQADTSPDAAPPPVLTLQKMENGAVVGFASWAPDPTWPETHIVDVYCHPSFWQQAGELLGALQLPAATRQVAYVETDFSEKRAALEGAGFREIAVLPRHLRRGVAAQSFADVAVMQRNA